MLGNFKLPQTSKDLIFFLPIPSPHSDPCGLDWVDGGVVLQA